MIFIGFGMQSSIRHPWQCGPGDNLCLCMDFRGLNKVTKKDHYLLPLTKDLLDVPGKAKIYWMFQEKQRSIRNSTSDMLITWSALPRVTNGRPHSAPDTDHLSGV